MLRAESLLDRPVARVAKTGSVGFSAWVSGNRALDDAAVDDSLSNPLSIAAGGGLTDEPGLLGSAPSALLPGSGIAAVGTGLFAVSRGSRARALSAATGILGKSGILGNCGRCFLAKISPSSLEGAAMVGVWVRDTKG